MKTITAEHYIYAYGEEAQPALHVEQGEEFCMETHDRFAPLLRGEGLDERTMNRVTGYVYVEGVKPGQTLKVELIRIELRCDNGIIVAVPGLGGFKDKITQLRARRVPLDRHFAYFSERIKIPLRPMVGRIGTYPTGEPVLSNTPGPHGGNMDNNHITGGSTVYLPVYREGALLALGDLHAAMGDGECVISGVEAYGAVVLKCGGVDEPAVTRPMVATSEWVMTSAEGATLEEAHRVALDDMARLLSRRLQLDYAEAAMLISAAGELRICQIVNPKVGVKVMVPTSILTL